MSSIRHAIPALLIVVLVSLSSCFLGTTSTTTISFTSPTAGMVFTAKTLPISGYLTFPSGMDSYDVSSINCELTYLSSYGYTRTTSTSIYYVYSSSFSTTLSVPSDAIAGAMTMKVTVNFYSSSSNPSVTLSQSFTYKPADTTAPSLTSSALYTGSSLDTAVAAVSPYSYNQNANVYVKFSATDAVGVTRLSYSLDNTTSYKDVALDTASVSTSVSNKLVSLFTVPTTLGTGSHYLYLRVGDAAGNYSSYTYFTISVSIFAQPTVTIQVPSDKAVMSNVTSQKVYVNATKGSLALAGVSIAIDNGTAVSATSEGSTSSLWSYTFTGLTEAEHTLKAFATDSSGNSSTVVNSSFFVDNTAPNTPTLSINDGTKTLASGEASKSSSFTITATATDGGTSGSGIQKVELLIGGSTVLMTQNTATPSLWTYTLSQTAAATISLKAKATDNGGMVSGFSAIFSLNKGIAPTITANAPHGSGLTLNLANNVTNFPVAGRSISGSYSVSGTGYTVVASIGSSSLAAPTVTYASNVWSFMIPNTIEEGSHVISVTITDSNSFTASTSFTLVVDSSAPTVALLQDGNISADFKNLQNLTGAVTVIGSASDVGASGLANVYVKVDSGSDAAATLAGTNWTYTIPSGSMLAGSHIIYVRAVDKAGNNSGYSSFNPITYVTPPTVTASAVTATVYGASASLTVSAGFSNSSTPSGNYVRWLVDGTPSPSAASYGATYQQAANGLSWSGTINVTLPSTDGTHKIYLRSFDSFGFASAESIVTVVYDTLAPSISITAPAFNSTASIETNTATTAITLSGSLVESAMSPAADALQYQVVQASDGTTIVIPWTNIGQGATWSTSMSLGDGSYLVNIRARDAYPVITSWATAATQDPSNSHWSSAQQAFNISLRPTLSYSTGSPSYSYYTLFGSQAKWIKFYSNGYTAFTVAMSDANLSGSGQTAKVQVGVYSGSPESPSLISIGGTSGSVHTLSATLPSTSAYYWLKVEPASGTTGSFGIGVYR